MFLPTRLNLEQINLLSLKSYLIIYNEIIPWDLDEAALAFVDSMVLFLFPILIIFYLSLWN